MAVCVFTRIIIYWLRGLFYVSRDTKLANWTQSTLFNSSKNAYLLQFRLVLPQQPVRYSKIRWNNQNTDQNHISIRQLLFLQETNKVQLFLNPIAYDLYSNVNELADNIPNRNFVYFSFTHSRTVLNSYM